ncbi:MAG: YkgJ family cysteine cluster protein [Deltaproteobacteria bacterium]|nr:YkgJ family cysteine cluster protein [Deltaproteobacteria bacterium]
MGLFTRAYKVLCEEIYSRIPDVGCHACGRCCVSPHVTLVEFCHAFKFFLDNNPQKNQIITQIIPIHERFAGNLNCRFQESSGLCGVYSHRPMACRFHGHPAMEKLGFHYHVYCPNALQPEGNLSKDEITAHLDYLSNLNQRFYLHYTLPYWLSGLNIECWLTILFNNWRQAYFQSLKELMVREFGESVLDLAPLYRQNVRLKEKLDLIEQGQTEFQHGRKESARAIFSKIRNDFPETGTYYYFETEMYLLALEGKMANEEDLSFSTEMITSS